MNSITCTKCGLVAFATAAGCKRCGAAYAPAGSGAAAKSAPTSRKPYAPGGETYYSLSGEVTVAGLAAGLGGGLAAGAVLAFVYSYLISYIPFVYLNFLCTIFYAVGLGAAVGYLMRMGKMRNPAVSACVGLIVAFASYYLSWAVWLSIVVSGSEFSVSSFTLAGRPLGLWAVLQLVNEKGAWSIGLSPKSGGSVNGVVLWVVWGVEALIVLAGSPLVAWSALSMDPFCESCQVWCEEEKGLVSIRAAEADELKRRFEAKDFLYLKAVGPKDAADAEWCRLDLHRCPGCDMLNTLNVNRQKLTVDRKGKSTVSTSNVFQGLMLTQADVRQLRQLSAELTQPQSVAA